MIIYGSIQRQKQWFDKDKSPKLTLKPEFHGIALMFTYVEGSAFFSFLNYRAIIHLVLRLTEWYCFVNEI